MNTYINQFQNHSMQYFLYKLDTCLKKTLK